MKDILVAGVLGFIFGWACTYSYINYSECMSKGGMFVNGSCFKAQKL